MDSDIALNKQQWDGLSNKTLAILVLCIFIVLAIVGPVFFSQPEHLGQQILVSVLAFVTFVVLGGVHLGSRIRLRWWGALLVFGIVYLALFAFRDGDFRPDQFWFFMSPMGYVVGALGFRKPELSQTAKAQGYRTDGLVVQAWSSAGKIETPLEAPKKLVEQLDGHHLTLLQVINDLRSLEIAGGVNDRFVAYYADDRLDDESWSVYTEHSADNHPDVASQLMFIGDVEGHIPESFWSTRPRAQTLVDEFITSGRIDLRGDNHWINAGPMAGGMRPSLSTES